MHRGYLKALEKLGVQNGGRLIDKTIIVDFLMANFDRHTHNFGLIRDAEELDGTASPRCLTMAAAFTVAPPRPSWSKAATFGKATPSGNTPRSGLSSSRTLAGTTSRPLGTSKTSLQRFMAKPRDERALYSGRAEANPSADCYRERLGGRTRHHSARLVADALGA